MSTGRAATRRTRSFMPASMEAWGRVGGGAKSLLHNLADAAESMGKVDRRKFEDNTMRELSVALCRGNGMVLRAGRQVLVRRTGRAIQWGLVRATTDLV
jgi:hypothetical protein